MEDPPQEQQIQMCTVIAVPVYDPSQYYLLETYLDRPPLQHLCPPDKTLWMGSIDTERWDPGFITEAFAEFDLKVKNVKMVTEKGLETLENYCFVEFETEEEARNAMLKANGRTIKKDPRHSRFNLSFANPSEGAEFNLFVSNLAREVDDARLFKVFGEKYKSCRGARVYRDYKGVSKRMGFVRFASETDQQVALIEMDRKKLKGREMNLKLFSRYRESRGFRDHYSNSDKHLNQFRENHHSRSRRSHQSRSPSPRASKPKKRHDKPPSTGNRHNS